MLNLDGGEAGGQFLRTSLALAALTGTPVRVENVRGNRSEPGLGHQHLAAVEALAQFCSADVTGADVGAETVTFEPGPIQPRDLDLAVGTAGSLALVFDAVLPLAARIDEPLSISATGGTEVAWAPQLSYFRRVKLPLVRRFGIQAAVERERTGFYPAGGGEATLHLGPSAPTAIDLTDRGDGRGVDVVSMASEGLGDSDVAERQATAIRERLDDSGLTVRHETTTYAETGSPGSAVLVALTYGRTRAGFSALGEPGKPAEDVGEAAVTEALAFHEGDAVVDRYLADQLLVFGALAGGRLLVPEVTEHVETSLALLEQFGAGVSVSDTGDAVHLAIEAVER